MSEVQIQVSDEKSRKKHKRNETAGIFVQKIFLSKTHCSQPKNIQQLMYSNTQQKTQIIFSIKESLKQSVPSQ